MKQAPFVFLLILLLLLAAPMAHASDVGNWRGINIGANISDAGLERIHSIGFNVVRLSMNKQPLMQKQAPYDFDEAAFTRMKTIVDACRAHGLKVIIDPHTTPGTAMETTTLGSDPIWRDRSYQNLLVTLWDRISKDYAGNPTVVGYDLLNEPVVPGLRHGSGDGMSWNEMVATMVRQIRRNDHKTTIIMESFAGRNGLDALQTIKLPSDDNLALSIHAYMPKDFTSQGLRDHPLGIRYPGTIAGENWDRAMLEEKLRPVQEFAAANHVEVFVGEFSASRFGDPVSTNAYLGDLLQIFRKFGWGWAYHSYGEAYAWSFEDASPPPGSAVPQVRSTGSAAVPSRADLFEDFLKGSPAK